MYPWILEDLDDPHRWLQMTCLAPAKIDVSVNEASDAMSAVHFRWRWGGKIAKHITSVFRNVRPVYLSSSALTDDVTGVKSDPHVRSVNHDLVQNKYDKGKWKATTTTTTTEPNNHSPKRTNSKATRNLHPKSNDHWCSQGDSSAGGGGSQTSVNVSGREISPLISKSGGGGGGRGVSGSEKRSRFGGLFSNWRPTKFQQQQQPSSSSSNTNSPSSYTQPPIPFGMISGAHPSSRRSEEALRFFRNTSNVDDGREDEEGIDELGIGGRLTAARRASSWGEGDKKELLHEVVSVTSIERELDEHEMNVGAGGVSRDGDFGINLAGRSSSFPFFDSILGSSGPSGPSAGPSSSSGSGGGNGGGGGGVEEMFNERYGQPFYDEDSSTLASGPGRGDDDDNDDDDDDDDDIWQGGFDEDGDEGGDGGGVENVDEDDGNSSDQEHGVIFSPRRRPSNSDEE